MKNLRNNVRLIGRLGIDPQVTQFENGNKVARISLATSESYKDAKGNKVEETQWHRLVLWGKQVELAEKMLRKGAEIAIEGKIVNRPFKDKNGENRYITEIVLDNWLLLKNKAIA
jgi:single-strand DNA-binding protein